MQIIDHLAKPQSAKIPIKLIGCLQASLTNDKFSFGTEIIGDSFPVWPTPYGMNKIERIYRQNIDNEWYDVMIVGRENKTDCLFIGQWNDGIWEN